jgi:hypothetical protein
MRRALLAMGIAMAIALACVPAAWGGGKANTTVTMDAAFLNPDGTYWSGDIFSPKRGCKDGRRVLVFRVRPGDDQKIGATKSYKGTAQPGYFWTLVKEGLYRGKFYAKVKPTDACQGDRSETLTIA